MKAENGIAPVPELMAILERHRAGTWQLQAPFFWKLAAEMLIAGDEFVLARGLLDEASHLAGDSKLNWVKPELYRLYAVLAEDGADSAGVTPQDWLKQTLMQAREHGEKYAELCAARDLGRLYARSGEHETAREVLSAVSDSFIAGSDELVVRQMKALLDELG